MSTNDKKTPDPDAGLRERAREQNWVRLCQISEYALETLHLPCECGCDDRACETYIAQSVSDAVDSAFDAGCDFAAAESAAYASRVRVLEDALREWKCEHCGGRGMVYRECTLCGDSTYDHNCNDRHVNCEPCESTGRSPIAREALAASQARVRVLEDALRHYADEDNWSVASYHEIFGRKRLYEGEDETGDESGFTKAREALAGAPTNGEKEARERLDAAETIVDKIVNFPEFHEGERILDLAKEYRRRFPAARSGEGEG